ncbi:gliding motility-associated C-terminal domain-containing protein [Sporocytophaga myxococcoides]|uniref:T9SS type B sorting domain-containing protein n=1 Tax=Sporocytophaga myxococcoides TaxID=153721 RepID=UPI00138AD5D4|nr:gliding motility-associated C-terminal domain-containing protein [Sporocytophaga myxococcoides]
MVRPFILIVIFSCLCLIAQSQTGPAGVGMNDGSSSLKLWLDGGNGTFSDTLAKKNSKPGEKVLFWKDLSGSNNHVMSGSDSTNPKLSTSNPLLNNQSGIRFFRNDGKGNKRNFLVSKSFSKTNDITIYCIFHALTKAGGNNISPVKAINYDTSMWYFGAGLVDGGANGFTNDISLAFCDTSIAAGTGDSTSSTDYCVKAPASLNKTYFAVLQKEAWTGKLRIGHNTNTDSVYQAGTQPINVPSRYYIGSTSNAKANTEPSFFDGYIACVLVYNKILSSAEKIILENYLSAKYNIPLKDNDIYQFDDPNSGNFDFELIGIGKANDGTSQLSARGDGMVELLNISELSKGEFMFIAHNGKTLASANGNLPTGVQFRMEREWICSKTGKSSKVDLIIDPKNISSINFKDIRLIIDTDNDGSFAMEKIGEGVIEVSEVTRDGRYVFRGVELKHGNHFTLGKVNTDSISNNEDYFSPNGDGVSDMYYIPYAGKANIYDRNGKHIKTLTTPAFWDGTNDRGELLTPGLYFLNVNEDVQKTVTLIR